MNNAEIKLDDLFQRSLTQSVEEISPDFVKKNYLTEEQITKIINIISESIGVSPDRALIGLMLLFLKGAASAGTPNTLSVSIGEGKTIEKRHIVIACESVTNNKYIRRIAESIAPRIGEFAEKNKLKGELADSIKLRYKSETGLDLTDKEIAYCSSFSQSIPNLAEITSENLVKLLTDDYQRRFENKKRQTKDESLNNKSQKENKSKPKRKK